jgi:hypothetical protein
MSGSIEAWGSTPRPLHPFWTQRGQIQRQYSTEEFIIERQSDLDQQRIYARAVRETLEHQAQAMITQGAMASAMTLHDMGTSLAGDDPAKLFIRNTYVQGYVAASSDAMRVNRLRNRN